MCPRICIFQGIIDDVAVPVPGLAVGGIGDDAVGAGDTVDVGMVDPRVDVHAGMYLDQPARI